MTGETEPKAHVYKRVPLSPEVHDELVQAQRRRGLPSVAAAIGQAIEEWIHRPDGTGEENTRAFEQERERDFAAYDRLKDDIRTRYEGKYVAIAGGRLMAVTDTFEEAVAAVEQYRHHLVFPAGLEPIRDPVYIRRWTA